MRQSRVAVLRALSLLVALGAAAQEPNPAGDGPAPGTATAPRKSASEVFLEFQPTPALPFPDPEDLKPVPDPEPLVFLDGRKVQTKEDWEARKKEILDLAHHYIYGFCPPEQFVKGTPPPEVVKEVKDAYGGLATMREIKVSLTPEADDADGTLWLCLAIPNKGEGPFPAVLQFGRPKGAHATTTSNSEVDQLSEYAISRGYAVAGFSPQGAYSMYKYYFPIHSGPWVDGKDPRFSAHPSPNVRNLGPRPLHGWGERVIWAWRMRRVMDALVTQKDVDAKRVIFVGGSRGGMSVLMAAALDERAAMVYAWQPAGLRIRGYNWPDRPEWLAPAVQMFQGKLDRLPVDTYCVAATLAPRPVLFTATHTGYTPMGAEVQMGEMPAPGQSVIYSKGPIGLHVRDGTHAWVLDDFKAMLDFADERLKPNPKKETMP